MSEHSGTVGVDMETLLARQRRVLERAAEDTQKTLATSSEPSPASATSAVVLGEAMPGAVRIRTVAPLQHVVEMMTNSGEWQSLPWVTRIEFEPVIGGEYKSTVKLTVEGVILGLGT